MQKRVVAIHNETLLENILQQETVDIPGSSTRGQKRRYTENGPMNQFVEILTADAHEKLVMQFSNFIFSTGLPFTVTENSLFREWIRNLNPSFKLPCRKDLANKLLDKAYEELKIKIDEKIKESKRALTLVSEGWTNI